MDKHIVPNHGEVSEELISNTLTSPDMVYTGTSNPDHLMFVNRSHVTASGSPFVVFVNPVTEPSALVVSASHRRDLKNPKEETIIWSPPKS